jgi:deazaflavin-dependent oxidoreductase (nitroreductase family)
MTISETTTIDNSAASRRSFPLQGTMLFELVNNPEFKQSFHARLQASNRFFVFFYKIYLLPLIGMGKQIMVLSTRGRTSHKVRDFPIGYFLIDGTVHIFSGWGRGTNWYKNIMANPNDVYLQVGFRRFHATPEVVEDPAELRKTIERFIICCPKGAQQLIGWDPEQDSLETADFSMMMENVLVVKFHDS